MPTTLVTGGNKGLGYEAARRLVTEGHEVWVAARDRDRGAAAAETLGVQFVEMDVTDDASVAAARDIMADAGGLDVLINNAGIVGPRAQVPETTAEDVRITFETNVFGPVRVVHAFTGLLDASSAPVVVNVSSGVGSLEYASDPLGPASAAKAAIRPESGQMARPG